MKHTLILFILASFLTLSANAKEVDWKAKVRAQKSGTFPNLKETTLSFKGSFNNIIPAGKVNFVFNRDDKRYKQYYISQCYGGSTFKLLKYKFDMTSFASSSTLKPMVMVANEFDEKGSDKVTNKFSGNSVVHTKVSKSNKTKKSKTSTKRYSGLPLHDALTGILFIRKQKLKVGEKIYLCAHPFNTPYFCTVTVLGKEKLNKRAAIKLDVALRKIDRKTGKLLPYTKMKKTTIWVSDDAQRIPLEFRVEVKLGNKLKIGSVRLKLVSSK